MEYTLELAERLVENLRAMPPKAPSKRRLDKQGLVKHLAEEIASLQQRGYTIEEVAESLRGHGLDITTPTLKNYLQRARGKRVKPRKPQRPSEARRPRRLSRRSRGKRRPTQARRPWRPPPRQRRPRARDQSPGFAAAKARSWT